MIWIQHSILYFFGKSEKFQLTVLYFEETFYLKIAQVKTNCTVKIIVIVNAIMIDDDVEINSKTKISLQDALLFCTEWKYVLSSMSRKFELSFTY